MAKTGSKRTSWGAFLVGPALLGGILVAVGGCEPAVPASPAYVEDVRPIFMSHCVRCHGAGGTLNTALVPVPDGGPVIAAAPENVYLNQFYESGDCAGNGADCHYGALFWASASGGAVLDQQIHGPIPIPMPPPPAPRLDDWEFKVIDAWLAEKPQPRCSNSANPDPALCPPDAGQ